MFRGPGSAGLPRAPGPRKLAPRSLSCLSDLDGSAAPEPRPCRPPGSPGRAPPPLPAPSGCEPRLRPIILRRARSLPSSLERRQKATGAPGAACGPGCSRQHRVRFADALGLELTQVKVFNAGDDPSVPLHVLSRLAINSDLCCSSQDLEFNLQCLVPDFPPPIEAADFGERVGRQLVCLERVTCSDLGISGTVRVRNVAFEKQLAQRARGGGAVARAGGRRGHRGRLLFWLPSAALPAGSRLPRALRAALPSGRRRVLGQQQRPRLQPHVSQPRAAHAARGVRRELDPLHLRLRQREPGVSAPKPHLQTLPCWALISEWLLFPTLHPTSSDLTSFCKVPWQWPVLSSP
uniref:Protein phosphatase 1 regulatory subunit 3D n=1 Tax=Equus caballus TaxID=9796 RepID=A0A9L0SE12_HORSE